MNKRIFIDINIAIDLLSERNPFYASVAQIFSLGDEGKINISFSSLGFSILDFIISKERGKTKSREILRKFKMLVKVLSVDEKIINLALNSDFRDFEDAIQYEVAKENKQEIIISRNLKDFKTSEIPVFLPEDFLKLLLVKQ